MFQSSQTMRRTTAIILLLCALTAQTQLWAHSHSDTLGIGRRIEFVHNAGQWDERVRYVAQMGKAALFLENNSLMIAVREVVTQKEGSPFHHDIMGSKAHAYRMTFEGANARPEIEGVGQLPSYSNYYTSRDPGKWRSHVRSYASVNYRGLYEGIDLHVYSASRMLKYDFIVAPNARPSDIVIAYEGQNGLKLHDGNLTVKTSVANIVEVKPYAYQIIGKDTVEVAAAYKLRNKRLTFEIGNYDRRYPLVIDPQLYFSTYTGSTADNWGTTATYDSHKNTYTAGLVFALGYPTSTGAYSAAFSGNVDVGIFKFDTTGSERMYATYLGGSFADMPHSLFVNTFDELIVFGTTGSEDFPVTEGAFMTQFVGGEEISYIDYNSYYHHMYYPTGSDIFVSRFSSDGTQLLASTFVGGSGNDGLNYRSRYNTSYVTIMQGNDSLYYNYGDGVRGELITDDMNNVYVGTTTMSADFPVSENCLQPNRWGSQDGVVFKLDYNLQNLLWSTYLGGSGDDAIYSIDVDRDYNLLVCGGTTSHNFPTTASAYQPNYGGGSTDGFVAKISYNGDQLMHSTYFGSDKYDQCYFVRTGKRDEVFIFGQTKATGSTMIYNANYNTPGAGMLLARLAANLTSRVWSTVFGTPLGTPNLSPTAFAADICNRIYAAGWGRDFVGYNGVTWGSAGTANMEVTSNAYQSQTDGQDFYIISMDEYANEVDYATFFGEYHATSADRGADHVDGGTSRFDKMSTIYQSVCGSCGGTNSFPITDNAWSATNNSYNCNNAIFRMNIHSDYPVAEFLTPPAICYPQSYTFQNTGRGTSYLWDFGDGSTSHVTNPTHTYAQPGTYTVRLVAFLEGGCRGTDTAIHDVVVLSNGSHSAEPTYTCTATPIHIGITPMLGCTYQWIRGNVSDPRVANPMVSESGIYVLQIDGGVCVELDTFEVHFVDLIDTVLTTDPNCPGGSDGRAQAILSSDACQPITYQWGSQTSTSATLTGLPAGTYHLIVSDAHCTATKDFRIVDPPIMQLHKETVNELCNDTCTAWIRVWSEVSDTVLSNLCPGTYIVEMDDSHGCPYYDTTEVIRVQSFSNMHVWADDTTIFRTETTHLHVTDLPNSRYNWTPTETLGSPFAANTAARPEDTTMYYVTVTDSAGCTWSDSILINCIDVNCGKPNVFIPNAFTPNDDGKNDKLCFSGEWITDFYIAIFSRWGELLYESHDLTECWDGRYKGNLCLPGVYAYTCRITCEAGFKGEFKGDITLIR